MIFLATAMIYSAAIAGACYLASIGCFKLAGFVLLSIFCVAMEHSQ